MNASKSLQILVVDDDPASLRLVERQLASAGYEVWTAEDGAAGLRMVLDRGPDVVVTDYSMPVLNGIGLCSAIRENEFCGFVYVILLTASSDPQLMTEAFDAGIDDYIGKPFQKKEILARLRAAERVLQLKKDLDSRHREVQRVNAEMQLASDKLTEANYQLKRLATTDTLTGLANRREAMQRLEEAWSQSDRNDDPISCIMVDVDHFKNVNDTYGHAVGDQVLRAIAETLRKCGRVGEVICRVGGEEFLIICPRSAEQQVLVAAERFRWMVERHEVETELGRCPVTISLGVAERTQDMARFDDLLKAADTALYHAKRSGRNRVSLASMMLTAAVAPASGEVGGAPAEAGDSHSHAESTAPAADSAASPAVATGAPESIEDHGTIILAGLADDQALQIGEQLKRYGVEIRTCLSLGRAGTLAADCNARLVLATPTALAAGNGTRTPDEVIATWPEVVRHVPVVVLPAPNGIAPGVDIVSSTAGA